MPPAKPFLPIVIALMLLLCSTDLLAQQPVIEWQKSFGGTGYDAANCIIQTADGGYIIAGSTSSVDGDVTGLHNPSRPYDDFWIVKINNGGSIEWKKCLGGSYNDIPHSIVQTSDGGYIIAGETGSSDGDVTNTISLSVCWVVKITNTGNIQWQKTYGGHDGQSSAYGIQQTTDGGFIVSATTSATYGDMTNNHGARDIWMLKLSSDGSLQWQKCYGGSRDDYAKDVLQASDGGFIIMGNTTSDDGDVKGYHEGYDPGIIRRYKLDAWVIKISNNGLLQWQTTIGGSEWDAGTSIVQADDGGYVFTGYTLSSDGNVTVPVTQGFSSIWNVKLANSGAVLWQKNYGGIQFQQGNCIKKITGGGYIIAAESFPDPLGDTDNVSCNTIGQQDYWVLKIDAGGSLIWQQSYGSNASDFAYSVVEASDGGYVVAGLGAENTGDIMSGHTADFWIIKLHQGPYVPTIAITSSDSLVCSSATVTFTSVITFGGSFPHYQWKKNGANVGNDAGTFTTTALSNQDTVYCVLTCTPTCASQTAQSFTSNRIVVAVPAGAIQPSLKITPDSNPACLGFPVTFTTLVSNSGPSPSFQWKLNGNNILNANSSSYISSSLIDLDTIICELTPANAACYVAVSDSVVMRIDNHVQPEVSVTASSTSTCEGTAVKFTASPQNGGTNPAYQWKVNNNNVSINSNVYITSSLHNGDMVSCDIHSNSPCAIAPNASSNEIAITVNPVLPSSIVISSGSTFPVCSGDLVSFSALIENGGISPLLQWQVNGVDVAANSGTYAPAILNSGDIINCLLTADSTAACITMATYNSNKINAVVKTPVTASITVNSSDSTTCKGSPVLFTAITQNEGSSPLYQWKLNGNNAGSNSPTFDVNSLVNNDQVYCTVVSSDDCKQAIVASNIVNMTVNDVPIIKVTASKLLVDIGQQVQLNATVQVNITNFDWQPSASLINPNSLSPLTIPLTGNTNFTFNVKNIAGCRTTDTIMIKVLKAFYMPSAFSPNGDGINDVYRIPPNVSFTLKKFIIYNRWGKQVFLSADSGDGWNGTINGEPAPNGTYIYVVSGTDPKGNVFVKGNFVLVR